MVGRGGEVKIEESQAGKSMLEKGTCIDESESASATGHWEEESRVICKLFRLGEEERQNPFRCKEGGRGGEEDTLKIRRNIRIALPWTAKRRVARWAAVRSEGVGEGGPVREERSRLERTISGRVRLVSSS